MRIKRIFWCILALLLLVLASPAFATHIVGGEFELLHQQNNRYTLRLILYNDDVNGNPGAIDPNAQVFIWSKRTNQLMMIVTLPIQSRTNVPYTNPLCAIAQLQTSKVVYSSDITLSAGSFNDPQGYYVTYERCCRNVIINNIERPDASGQTFYLEFPPVVKDGEPFINSSPTLFPPLSDFARLGYPFYFDFRGTDVDGDSLVYKLVTPLAGTSSPDAPIPVTPIPAPYPEVRWLPGYSTTSMVPGTPALSIDQLGYLKVKPDKEGLFVFSVMAEEYRNGVKIGEVRRDFQMLVYNVAGEDFPPVLQAEKPDGQIFKDFIRVTGADFPDPTQDRCVNLKVTDQDIKQEDGYLEQLTFRIVPQNFTDASGIELSIQNGTVTSDKPELNLQVCLPECPPVFNQPYRFFVVAYDDACSMPLTDTLRVEVLIPPPANEPAHFLSLANKAPLRQGTHVVPTVAEGSVYDFVLEGFDDDGDNLEFSWVAKDFNAQQYGFSFSKIGEEVTPEGRRKVKYGVRWDATCSSLSNFGLRDKFTFFFSLDDKPECDQHKKASYQVDFSVKLPGTMPPDVTTSLNNYKPVEELNQEVFFEDPLTFVVKATDPDVDKLSLRAVGADFKLEDYGMSFTGGGTGVGTVSGNFSWTPGCGNVLSADKDVFKVYFISQDDVLCKKSMGDTIVVNIKVKFPTNYAPSLSARVNSGSSTERLELKVGEQVSILLRGVDANTADGLRLSLQNINASSGAFTYTWEDVTGKGEVSSLLTFVANCDFVQGAGEAMVTFHFQVEDDPCFDKQLDKLSLEVMVKDVEQDFEPIRYVNVFTPNGDRCNAYFEIKDLPEDSCDNRFEFVRVYNRWGKLVFESSQRDFRWDGEGHSVGTYYYLLKYTNRTYRSPLSILTGDAATGADCTN